MRTILYLLLLILNLAPAFSAAADESDGTGTLIVSYSTGDRGDRLSRVRFLLSSDTTEEEMYPKGEGFVESSDNQSRLVVIENLPAGEYHIKFLAPNADNFFEEIPDASVTLTAGQVTKITQTLQPKYASQKSPNGSDPYGSSGNGSSQEIADSQIIRRPSGTIIINQAYAQLSVRSNQPNARWTLLYNDRVVYRGTGTVINYQVPEGDSYTIVPEEMEGFTVKTTVPYSFRLLPNESRTVGINYERTFGSLTLRAPFPDNEPVTLVLKPKDSPPIQIKLASKGGMISWQSKPLPTGAYEVSYILPPKFSPVPHEKIIIRQGEKTALAPQLMSNSILHITSNVPEAVFLLRTINNSKTWKGEGRDLYFRDLEPGMYQLSFSTKSPDYFIAPKEMRLNLSAMEIREINASYQVAGRLTVITNIDQSMALIQELGGSGKEYSETIAGQKRSFTLPEGRYKVTLSASPGTEGSPPSVAADVTVKPLSAEEIHLPFPTNQPPKPEQSTLIITTNIPAAGYSVLQVTDEQKTLIGHFTGKSVSVPLPGAGTYEINFDDVANFETPANAAIEVKQGESIPYKAIYSTATALIDIPAGRAIIGSPSKGDEANELPAKIVTTTAFSIGVYEVTNAEFAGWLNKALKDGSITYVREADSRGKVLDSEGRLLFKTLEGDPYSQISAQRQSIDNVIFIPLAGKDSYPVINVTWFGAVRYCKDNNCRLPTEAEWEKAAGMAPEREGEPLKKFRFGFGRDEIDPSWANYKQNDAPIQRFQVQTTPVGFYNGNNKLPLSVRSTGQETTRLAKSPYGAFDMSGNVWEWVSDWYDEGYTNGMGGSNPQGPESGTKKVAKGGCYDSLAEGVRVSERIGLPPDHADAFTGFRIAKDQ